MSSLSTFACLGGSYSNGKYTLTADEIILYYNESRSMISFRTDVELKYNELHGTLEELYLQKQVRPEAYKENDYIQVAFVKKDEGGIIYTIYAITFEEQGEVHQVFIKVNSNYQGNGVMARGADHNFPIHQSVGC
jgi:hypothetical protein